MPMLIIPTTICSKAPPTYEFQMKYPRPPPLPPDWLPPPEIISAATTTFQVIPMPTDDPTTIDGTVAGSTMRRNVPHVDRLRSAEHVDHDGEERAQERHEGDRELLR